MLTSISRLFESSVTDDGGSVTVPPMDGALKPNQYLETAHILVSVAAPDNLIVVGRQLHFTSGNALFEYPWSGKTANIVKKLSNEVSCASAAPDGTIALGLVDGTILCFNGTKGDWSFDSVGGHPIVCATAMAFADPTTLLLCIGSQRVGPSHWRRDLLEKGHSGSVWRINLSTREQHCLASNLSFPSGIRMDPTHGLIVCEAWKHRLISINPSGKHSVLLDELPGYPGRIVLSGKGSLLCVFAPRLPITEFMLQEQEYVNRMISEIGESYWMAPALASGKDFFEPLLAGTVKQFGILKPWAPTLSYGLIVRLDANYHPIASYHSRGDGTRHGVTSCLDLEGRICFASKGGDVVCSLEPPDEA